MKKIILCIMLYASSMNVFSQAVIGKQKTIGGSADEQLGGGWPTNDGGMILGGRSYSGISGEKTETNRGIDDYWVVKLNKGGNIEWQRSLGGIDVDEILSLQQTKDGGYILGGNSQSVPSADKADNKGVFDGWVIKLNSFGSVEWQKTLGGDSYEFCNSIQQTRDGGYIVGCMSLSNVSGDKSENSKGGFDFWIIKLNSKGDKQWDKTLGGSGDEFANKVIQTADGGYLAVGLSNSNISGDKTENARGGFDYWAVKLDNNGNRQWDKTIGGDGDDYVNDVLQTPGGLYALFGASGSNVSGDKNESSRGGQDFWLVMLNRNGSLFYQKTMGGSFDEYGQSIDYTTDGGLILAGISSSPVSGEKTEESRGFADYWVVKLSRNGTITWDKTIGGNNDDNLRSIKEIEMNKYIIAGFSRSDLSGDKTEFSRGGSDYWVVNINDNGSSAIPRNDAAYLSPKQIQNDKIFSVYPNPVKDLFTIKTNGKDSFTLTDESGKLLMTKNIENTGSINVSAYLPGLYFIKSNTTGMMQRIIVTK